MIFELLDDRARPAVRDDQRQRVLVLRSHVDEVDVEAVDLGDELRQRVEPRLDLAPVVVCRPVARQLLGRRELHALRRSATSLLFGPAGRQDAAAKIVELLLRNVDAKGTDRLAPDRRVQIRRQQARGTESDRDGQEIAPRRFIRKVGHGHSPVWSFRGRSHAAHAAGVRIHSATSWRARRELARRPRAGSDGRGRSGGRSGGR